MPLGSECVASSFYSSHKQKPHSETLQAHTRLSGLKRHLVRARGTWSLDSARAGSADGTAVLPGTSTALGTCFSDILQTSAKPQAGRVAGLLLSGNILTAVGSISFLVAKPISAGVRSPLAALVTARLPQAGCGQEKALCLPFSASSPPTILIRLCACTHLKSSFLHRDPHLCTCSYSAVYVLSVLSLFLCPILFPPSSIFLSLFWSIYLLSTFLFKSASRLFRPQHMLSCLIS